ncbi:unnamed protein product [Psylliodes chrysocephalus]|uniref:DUF4780 domain-containing protein n=1 Tax=Psylliodes chrysocephalus TaxID=3402493 RepID=A0A9P0CU53_9CUCU|nr:unnamed protein product [Psylliodes chrysocephala]
MGRAALAVGSMDELPKASLWIPEEAPTDLDEKEIVLRRLEGQNPNLHVAKWCTFHHETKKDPKGNLFVFGIRDEDVGSLKVKSMRVSFVFTSSLTIRPNAEAGPSEE